MKFYISSYHDMNHQFIQMAYCILPPYDYNDSHFGYRMLSSLAFSTDEGNEIKNLLSYAISMVLSSVQFQRTASLPYILCLRNLETFPLCTKSAVYLQSIEGIH